LGLSADGFKVKMKEGRRKMEEKNLIKPAGNGRYYIAQRDEHARHWRGLTLLLDMDYN
jgi:hypothetical protein